MSEHTVRVRFAPSPTGFMHLGNIRTALMNYLFAKKKDGTFILRIEDTDPERNFDPQAGHILADLDWLGITYSEGPEKPGDLAPYFQSQRMDLYEKKLKELIDKKSVYRCFCTKEELDKKRARQIAMKKAPRYDRTCLNLSDEELKKKLDDKKPFIWRIKLDHTSTVSIEDIAHGTMSFKLKNFSDFPITRQNGTYTFMFANFVDDMTMKITHVIRGEDHLTNTAGQAALFKEFGSPLPTFWHMPILCNIEGKKLSKRDFGFALKDLKKAGYLPEAICNYLATLGASFKDEIMSLNELTQKIDFENTHAKGQIKYDVEKLRWINKKWIMQYNPAKLTELCKPYLTATFSQAEQIDNTTLTTLIQTIKTDLTTVTDVSEALKFYFNAPEITKEKIATLGDEQEVTKIINIIVNNLDHLENSEHFLQTTKQATKENDIAIKMLFSTLRFGLMGTTKGPGIKELLEMLGVQESKKRLVNLQNQVHIIKTS